MARHARWEAAEQFSVGQRAVSSGRWGVSVMLVVLYEVWHGVRIRTELRWTGELHIVQSVGVGEASTFLAFRR